MQSRKHSLVESCMNVLSGMMLAFLISQMAHEFQYEIQRYIWAGFRWEISGGSNAVMTALLTIVSIVRGYAWRRYFNKKVIDKTENKPFYSYGYSLIGRKEGLDVGEAKSLEDSYNKIFTENK